MLLKTADNHPRELQEAIAPLKSTINSTIGRHSEIAVSVTTDDNGCSYLQDVYFTPPNKLITLPLKKPVYQESATASEGKMPALEAIQMSASPGLMAGDQLMIDIHLQRASQLTLRTQAYQRIMAVSHHHQQQAVQHCRVRLSPGSMLTYLPHPYVLHQGSRFQQSNTFHLSGDSRLIFAEVMACGRALNEEKFAFDSLSSDTKIYIDDVLVSRENLQIQPKHDDYRQSGFMEDYTHLATLYFAGVPQAQLKNKTDALYALMDNAIQKNGLNVLAGISIAGVTQPETIKSGTNKAGAGVIKCSMLGHQAEALFQLVQLMSAH